jgi:hypothetical protein
MCEDLQIGPAGRRKLAKSLAVLTEAGYEVASSEQIPDAMVLHDKVVFATNDMECVSRALDTEEKRQKIERIIDRYGCEHLMKVRCILNNSTFADFC